MNNAPNKSVTADILARAGKCLFIPQMIEFSLSNLCSMFPDVVLDMRYDAQLFGLTKKRTPSVKDLKKALKLVGIDPTEYLFPEIVDFFNRRDWLAHRIFLEFKQSVSRTRKLQVKMLEEMSERGLRLIGVLAAVQYHIASTLGVDSPIPTDNPLKNLVNRNIEEGYSVLEKMLLKKSK